MQDSTRCRFGEFEVDFREHELRLAGRLVPLPRQSFALLAILLSRPGLLFTKDELFAAVWRGRAVTDSALTRAIQKLRSALEDDAAAPRYIATAHGLGFRFIAAVAREPCAPVATLVLSRPNAQLVGREAESHALEGVLSAASSGQRQV